MLDVLAFFLSIMVSAALGVVFGGWALVQWLRTQKPPAALVYTLRVQPDQAPPVRVPIQVRGSRRPPLSPCP